jgi:hypothetical protein
VKEVAATTTLGLERYPFRAALHWIVVAAGVFFSVNREILATATHTGRKFRIFFPKSFRNVVTLKRNSCPRQRKRRDVPRNSRAIIWPSDNIVMQTTPVIDTSPFITFRDFDYAVTLGSFAL